MHPRGKEPGQQVPMPRPAERVVLHRIHADRTALKLVENLGREEEQTSPRQGRHGAKNASLLCASIGLSHFQQ